MYDLIFTGKQDFNRERVDGDLEIPSANKKFKARSGSRTLLPLPNGLYYCDQLQIRTKGNMSTPGSSQTNDGRLYQTELIKENYMSIAWSLHVNPQFSSGRTLLRIHPDGTLPGTRDCIGLLSEVGQCYEIIDKLLKNKSKNKTKQSMIITSLILLYIIYLWI